MVSCLFMGTGASARVVKTELLVVGGGASGTTAAIQASRMGVSTLVLEETTWLGGMLTAAGVSAIDGNHNLPSGLWAEFRQKLYDYYGGPKAVETGWVSNTLFEPSIGDRMLKELARNRRLTVWYKTRWQNIVRADGKWIVTVQRDTKKEIIEAAVIIDATELGDVAAFLKSPYSIGMDSRHDTGESFAPEQSNDIIQDLTYVAILKDFGKGADKTLPRPEGYDPEEFRGSCDIADPAGHEQRPKLDCMKMMEYGKLPNNKFMINWPKKGNDIYLNIIEKTPADRAEALREAKLHTLRFVYYLQTELELRNLGLAEGEFPTVDGLPMIPYHRESRRIKGKVTLTLNDVAAPYSQKTYLYRTGIAVGDYPIDHHHLKNPDAPAIDFVRIRVPSYNVPLGALIPRETPGLIVAEKSISVTNIVNGATRLQPVVLTIGQAAGALAAVCISRQVLPENVAVRDVQEALLRSGAYLMPFIDVKPEDNDFAAIQRIGATGILRGTGIPYKWANQTWFYPEHTINEFDFLNGLKSYYPQLEALQGSGKALTLDFFADAVLLSNPRISKEAVKAAGMRLSGKTPDNGQQVLTRRQVAKLLDTLLDPFRLPVDFEGRLVNDPLTKN